MSARLGRTFGTRQSPVMVVLEVDVNQKRQWWEIAQGRCLVVMWRPSCLQSRGAAGRKKEANHTQHTGLGWMQDWLGSQNTHTAEDSWQMKHEIAAGYGKVEYIHVHMVAIIPHPPSSVNLASFRPPPKQNDPCGIMPEQSLLLRGLAEPASA